MLKIRPQPKSIISIDVGRKRIGLAGCDPFGITIKKLPPIIRKEFSEDLKILKVLCHKRKAEGLIIGLPLDESGRLTKQAIYSEKYGRKLSKALCLPIAWVNEHSSTWAAGELYGLHGDRSGQLDSAAAALLLEQWLHEGPELRPV